ncbi:hypothetical protein BJX70DRAFT_403108 [Aspergillus crustosus]
MLILFALWLLCCPTGLGHAHAHTPQQHHRRHNHHQSVSTSSPTSVSLALPTLLRRAPEEEDYTCGPKRECSNKACCGPSNVCGYGELYCGDGCQSNCDATAECGRDAAMPGQECPLNICCSQFGFCGTTADFCGSGKCALLTYPANAILTLKGCQSNCNDPERPSPAGGNVQNKVIGYYELWRANGDEGGGQCGIMTPEQIPVEYLDQVNVAFAFISPLDFSIIAMDNKFLDADLYQRVVDLKSRNPDVKVWISVGGWTFNDPGIFQSVFRRIAADEANTLIFTYNLMGFLFKHGFDGVDIDWEYPGADDRGGVPEDVVTFPRMLRTLKTNLQRNIYGKNWGISITVPTSYWYLRWFDIHTLESVVDEFNLMSYDLHGIWDRENPIGPYVYAHTNLTEIDHALDLFWRNGVHPNKINLGFAFYARTFELETPFCSSPGCEFKGPGEKGPCTDTGGILSYREIQEKLQESGAIPYYDERAAVFHVTYGEGGGNWASFDDGISFQKKIDLANQYGLGGLLIWAIDQDDDFFHALRAVTGQNVTPLPVSTSGWGAFDIDDCYITNCGESCNTGDMLMTKLNQDESRRGCEGDDHTARSFCCKAHSAPDPETCYWTGGPTNCHGQCDVGEVTMVMDDYGDSGKRCTNGGRKAWCCPATNGQEVIQKCELTSGWAWYDEPCPKDKPQELTAVWEWISHNVGYNFRRFCCPADSVFEECGWHGDNEYCNDSECPAGQVELLRWHGDHEGPPTSGTSCNKGRQQAFCCNPPLSGGSPFLPVPLANLFPEAGSFKDSFSTTFAVAVDSNEDETSADVQGTDPDKQAFSWIIMVGEEEDVQSFQKRDGSHLELFDCPSTHPDDFSTQHARAACVGGTEEDNNCEDIQLGGVEGTIIRLPEHCGPDTYVRAVRFEPSSNLTVPSHIRSARVYDFHYDYDFQNLRRDGAEVYFRADLSTHPGFWEEVVASEPGSPVKRSASTWRELDRRWWSETKDDWLKRFNALLVQGGTGLEKQYTFRQCLFEADVTCGSASASAHAEAMVYGSLNTTMDLGMSLIGTLRNFGFSESYAYFNQESFSMRMGAALAANARLYFDSGWASIGSFDAFGMNMYLKGIFSINPYFQVDARMEADAYISTEATVELTLSHERFRYFLPADLRSNPNEVTGSFQLDPVLGPVTGNGVLEAKIGGGLVISTRPTIGINIQLQMSGREYVDTSIKLSTPGSIRFDVALTTSCPGGMQMGITGQMDVDFDVSNALPGWSSKSYNFKDFIPKTMLSECIPFLDPLTRRDTNLSLSDSDLLLLPRQTLGSPVHIPDDQSSATCAFSTEGVYCGEPQDSEDPNCDFTKMPPLDVGIDPDTDNTGDLTSRGLLVKRSPKSAEYCNGKRDGTSAYTGFTTANVGTIQFSDYPPAGLLVSTYYPDAPTYDAEDVNDCKNLKLVKLASTPQTPGTGSRTYATEHILEAQTVSSSGTPSHPNQILRLNANTWYIMQVRRFFNAMGVKWSQPKKASDPRNANTKTYETPVKGVKTTIPWCEWMQKWWEPKDAFNSNNDLGSVYPGKKEFVKEMVLLETYLNSAVKQGWFSGSKITGENAMKNYIRDKKWDSVAKILKAHILGWQYYYVDDIKDNLVRVVNRFEKRLLELDSLSGIGTKVGNNKGKYDKAYIPQDLAAEWKKWVRAEHTRVENYVKSNVQSWARQAYNANRPGNQKNKKWIEIFEVILDAAENLKKWDIQWDTDPDADDGGNGAT